MRGIENNVRPQFGIMVRPLLDEVARERHRSQGSEHRDR
jgi:hypothetical protein